MAAVTARSQPYPWPWHGAPDPARMALVVCWDAGGPAPDEASAARLAALAAIAAKAGVTVIALPGAGAVTEIVWLQPAFTMVRPHFGGFSGTDLDFTLRRRGLTDLLFAGFPFELGADCTMRQANDLGYECIALTDCCTGMAADTLAGAISSVQMSGGIFGAVADSAAILDLLARVAPGRPAPITTGV